MSQDYYKTPEGIKATAATLRNYAAKGYATANRAGGHPFRESVIAKADIAMASAERMDKEAEHVAFFGQTRAERLAEFDASMAAIHEAMGPTQDGQPRR